MIKKYIATALFIVTIGLLSGCGATESKDIGKDKAQEIAFADANVTESNLSQLHISRETEDGKVVYEIKFTDTISGASYDYEILASDGSIQSIDKENGIAATTETQTRNQNSSQPQNDAQAQVSIRLEEAKKLVLNRVSGATENDIQIELDYDDGHYVYEGELLYGQKEYEFEIDANTGTFLEWSEERR